MRAAPLTLGLLLGALWCAPARAQQAGALAEQGRELFARAVACEKEHGAAEGEAAECAASYALAADAFGRAHALDGDPKHLFNQAQAERLSGDCEAAVTHYRAFLGTSPTAELRATVVRQLDKCGADETAPPQPPPPPPPTAPPLPPPPPPTTPAPEPPPTMRWYEDGWGHLLFGVGIAGAGVGATLLGLSYAAEERLGEPDTTASYAEHEDDVASAGRLRTGGAVALGLGGAALIGAVIRYVVVDGSLQRGDSGVAPLVAPGAAGLTWSGTF